MSSIKIKIRKDVRRRFPICESFNNNPGELINVLHQTQDFLGYFPAKLKSYRAGTQNSNCQSLRGCVVLFILSMIPKGKYPISVCMGTACYVRGAEKVLEEFKKELGIAVGETDKDGLFSLNSLRCVGACGLAPVVLVGDKVYGRLSPEDVKGIIQEYKSAQ